MSSYWHGHTKDSKKTGSTINSENQRQAEDLLSTYPTPSPNGFLLEQCTSPATIAHPKVVCLKKHRAISLCLQKQTLCREILKSAVQFANFRILNEIINFGFSLFPFLLESSSKKSVSHLQLCTWFYPRRCPTLPNSPFSFLIWKKKQ